MLITGLAVTKLLMLNVSAGSFKSNYSHMGLAVLKIDQNKFRYGPAMLKYCGRLLERKFDLKFLNSLIPGFFFG